jgi:hypothetical protein
MKVWVTRDAVDPSDEIGVYYCGIFREKPTKTMDRFHSTTRGDSLYSRNTPWFKETFGFTPRKGSCKQYELSIKEVK